MNHEQLILCAGVAIAKFQRHNDSTCVLFIENHTVRSATKKVAPVHPPSCLVITPFQQTNGLTSNHWDSIGKALSDQLKLETPK